MNLRWEIALFLEPRIKEYMKTCPPEQLSDLKKLHKAMEAESMGYGVDMKVITEGLEAFGRLYKNLK
jgi:hypothetical protein